MNDVNAFTPKYKRCNLAYQYVAVFSGILLNVSLGMHIGWPSSSLPLLLNSDSKIATSKSDASWIAASIFITQPIGSIAGALLVNRIGRKACLLVCSPVFIVSWLTVAYASTVYTLELARAIAGIVGALMYVTLPLYVGEIADKNIRGFLGCAIQSASKLGILSISIMGLYLDIRTTALLAAGIPVVHFLIFVWMPESPYFLILQNNEEKAIDNLKKFTTQDVDEKISEMKSIIKSVSFESGYILDEFNKPSNRKIVGIMLALRSIEQFSGYYAITSYCLIIFNEAGGIVNAGTATTIYFGVQLLASVLSCIIVDKAGRKILLIISLTGSICALLLLGMYFSLKYKTNIEMSSLSFVPLAAMLLFVCSYSIGMATIPVLLLGEIFPLSIKAVATCISNCLFTILAVVVTKLFQIVKDELGMHVAFFISATYSILGLIIIIRYLPETKGRSLGQIQMELEQFTKPRKLRNNDVCSGTQL